MYFYHLHILNTYYFECISEKYDEMLCTIHTLKTVQKLSVEWWTFHTLNKRHIGAVAEVA